MALVVALFAMSDSLKYSLVDVEIVLARSIGFFAALGAALGFMRFAMTLKQYFGTEEIVRYSWLMALAFLYYAVFLWLSQPIVGIPIQVYLLVFSFLAAHASFRLVRVLSIAPGRPVSPPPGIERAVEQENARPRKAGARVPRKIRK